jgi:hypothetical protein
VGSGTNLAAMGKHFAKVLPSGRCDLVGDASVFSKDQDIEAETLYMRNQEGKLLDVAERDKLVKDSVARAVDARDVDGKPKYGCIIVHAVVGSKTGQFMTSESCMDYLKEQYGDLIILVVDACQGRFAEGSIRRWLDKDCVVLCTGSKFFAGPPFSGVCLMSSGVTEQLESLLAPPEVCETILKSSLKEYVSAPLISDDLPTLKSLLPGGPLNYGVLMRWTVALHGMEAYFAEVLETERIHLASSWTLGVRKLISKKNSPLMQLLIDDEDTADEELGVHSTIVNMICRCNRGTRETQADTMKLDELRRVQFLMATDLSTKYSHLALMSSASTRCFIGQPVELSKKGICILRVAASAKTIVQARHDGLDCVLAEDKAVFQKLMLVLGNWYLFEEN